MLTGSGAAEVGAAEVWGKDSMEDEGANVCATEERSGTLSLMIALETIKTSDEGASAVAERWTDAPTDDTAENCLISISQSRSCEREADDMEVTMTKRMS